MQRDERLYEVVTKKTLKLSGLQERDNKYVLSISLASW